MAVALDKLKIRETCKTFVCEGQREVVWNMILYGRPKQGERETEYLLFVGSRGAKTNVSVNHGASEGLAGK